MICHTLIFVLTGGPDEIFIESQSHQIVETNLSCLLLIFTPSKENAIRCIRIQTRNTKKDVVNVVHMLARDVFLRHVAKRCC